MTGNNRLMLTAFVPNNDGLVRDGRRSGRSRSNVGDRKGQNGCIDSNRRRMKRDSKGCRQILDLMKTTGISSGSTSSLSYSKIPSFDSFDVLQDKWESISSSSSSSLYIGTAEITPHSTTETTYDAVMPSTETLAGMGLIVVLCAVAAWVWSEQVVPVSRTKLALSKKDGEVKAYLDELKESSPTSESTNATQRSESSSILSSSNRDFSDDGGYAVSDESTSTDAATATLIKTDNVVTEDGTSRSTSTPTTNKVVDDRAFERWLFNDWLENNKSAAGGAGRGGRKKEPALPILKSAKWNSGDNPVVVAAALMIIGLILTAVVEQGSALLHSS